MRRQCGVVVSHHGLGMNETHMDESKVARVTGWSFGLFSLVLLGLTVLNHR
jgi:hypothetical protein